MKPPTEVTFTERYQPIVDRIIKTTLAGNDSFRKLEEICDDFGHRFSGSVQLDQAIAWAVAQLQRDGQENVRAEPVSVPRWVRGHETAEMLQPRAAPLVMLGLGGSVGTPPEGITAPVYVVKDEAELDAAGESVRGKIVLFNNVMPEYTVEKGTQYGSSVRFRSKGASLAAERGALACLVRSVTAYSLRSPHTGALRYKNESQSIPAAALSTEDADLIARLFARKKEVVVRLQMEAQTQAPVQSANVVAELRGATAPDEVVVIGGHIDSWDVGQGAHDDAGGCIQAMEAINVLRKLNLRPRRTIRVVLWTNEENGLAGGRQYALDHKDELVKHVAAIESDGGSYVPKGYSLECQDARCETIALGQMTRILSLLSPIGRLTVRQGGSGADIGPLKPAGIVLLGHEVEPSTYFHIHHTHADTVDKVDPVELSQNVAVLASVAYIIADMPERLGHATAEKQ